MDNIKCEIKLSKSYNSFGYSAEGKPEEADALRLYVMLKTFEFMDEFEQLKDVASKDRMKAIAEKLREMGFGTWYDVNGWHMPDDYLCSVCQIRMDFIDGSYRCAKCSRQTMVKA